LLSVLFTPTDTNYAATNLSVLLVVTPAPLSVTASNVARIYGQANPALGGTISGIQNSDNITATYATSATTNSVVGGYAIVPTLVDPNSRLVNYVVTTNNGTLTVSKAVLVITANSTNRLYNTANPAFTYTASGFVNGQTLGVLSGAPSLTTTAVSNSPAGAYPIIATNGTLSAVNYAFSFVNGTLTVNFAGLSADVIVLLSGPASAIQGSNFVYSLVITNAGPNTSSNIVVSDSLPANLLFVAASGSGKVTNSLVTWPPIKSLAVGAATNFTLTVKAPDAGTFTNIASALAVTYDPNPTNNNGVSPGSQAQTVVAPVQLNVIAGTPVLNPQTGLFEETVTVTNSGAVTVLGFRLRVTALTSGVTLYNATGTTNGAPYVDYLFPLNPSNSVGLILEFYNPLRRAFTNTLSVEAILPGDISLSSTNHSVAVSRVFTDTRNDDLRFVIEFVSVPGQTYNVIYSSDLITWKAATPSITANANVTQWYDDGPPKTESKPASVNTRYYRVIKF